MFKSKSLASIPNTLKRLGKPYTVNADNSNINGPEEAVNYSVKVVLKTYADALVGKIAEPERAEYSGQTKLARNDNGLFVASYVGYDRIYSNDFTSDPSWTNTDALATYDTTENYALVEVSNGTFKRYYKNLGYGAVLDNTNDIIIRFNAILPAVDTYDAAPAIGILDSAVATDTDNLGVTFTPTGSYWELKIRGNGSYDLNGTIATLSPDVLYTIDLIYKKSDNTLEVIVWDTSGYVGNFSSAAGTFSSVTADSIGLWNVDHPGASTFDIKLFGFEVWMNTTIVKISRDNCKSWEQLPVSPVTVGNNVEECAVAVDNMNVIYLVWTELDGTPANYYNVMYSLYNYNSEAWNTAQQVSRTTGNFNRVNPNISVTANGEDIHICWIVENSSGADLYYAYKGGAYIDEWDLYMV